MFLELHITIDPETHKGYAQNCKITYEGDRADEVSLEPDANLITRTALLVEHDSTQENTLMMLDMS